MKDQASPMPPGTEISVLRVTFFLERTRARVAELRRLIKDFSFQPPEEPHWLSANFLGPEGSKLSYFLHIDSDNFKSGDTVRRTLWIETSVREWPTPKPPTSLTTRPRFDQMHQELLKLVAKDGHQLGFFDAEVSVPTAHAPPTNVVAIPLTVDGRTLPVVGIEYGSDPAPGRVDGVRWRRTPRGTKVRLSYSREMDVIELLDVWTNERDRIGTYVQEALDR